LKPERWGSLLVQEKYQEEKACDKRHPYRITTTTIIIIIIIIMSSCSPYCSAHSLYPDLQNDDDDDDYDDIQSSSSL